MIRFIEGSCCRQHWLESLINLLTKVDHEDYVAITISVSLSSYKWSDIPFELYFFTFDKHMLYHYCFGFVLSDIFKIYFMYLKLKGRKIKIVLSSLKQLLDLHNTIFNFNNYFQNVHSQNHLYTNIQCSPQSLIIF